jgi:hypothetical protein
MALEYTDLSGNLREWRGLIDGEESLIANFIYYKWMKDNITQNTSLGVVEPKAENANVVSPDSENGERLE